MPRATKASRSTAASARSVHVTPVDTRWWPAAIAPSCVPRTAATTSSGAPEVAEPSTALMSKTSWSTTTPSAFSPSTSARRTVVGVIDTPSTNSTAPSDTFARRTQLPVGSTSHARRRWDGVEMGSHWPAMKTLLAQSSPGASCGEIVHICPTSRLGDRAARKVHVHKLFQDHQPKRGLERCDSTPYLVNVMVC